MVYIALIFTFQRMETMVSLEEMFQEVWERIAAKKKAMHKKEL